MREIVQELSNEQYGCIAIKFISKETFTKTQIKKA